MKAAPLLRAARVAARPADEAGFTLLEAVVGVALVVVALTGALCVLAGTSRAQARLGERGALDTLVDNFATRLGAGVAYADATNAGVSRPGFASRFAYDAGSPLGELACSEERLGTAGVYVVLSCRTADAVSAQRIVRVPQDVPAPGSVVTAAPSSP